MRYLEKLSNQIMEEMMRSPGIVDVSSDLELTKPEVRVLIDRNKASDVGVDIQEISSTVLQMVGGQQVSKFKDTERAKRYDVRIRLTKDQRMNPEDISQITIRTPKGGLIKLAQVIKVDEGISPNLINRKDRQRSTTIYADTSGGKVLGEALAEVETLAKRYVSSGYSYGFFGHAEAFKESFHYLFIALLQAIIIVYMVLAMQFNSFLHPLTVMLALPLSTYRMAQQDIRSLSHLIDDLFDVSQIDAGGLQLDVELNSIGDLISDTIESFSETARQQNVLLAGEVQPGTDPVRMDARRVGRVLANLTSNALRHTPAGGGIHLGAHRAASGVEVEVHDTGEGIRPEDLPYVFDRFYRGEKSRSRVTGGAGLGLAIARGIVEAHGGIDSRGKRGGAGRAVCVHAAGRESAI